MVWVVAMAMDVVVAATVVAAMDVPVTEAMDVAAGLPPLHINERRSLPRPWIEKRHSLFSV